MSGGVTLTAGDSARLKSDIDKLLKQKFKSGKTLLVGIQDGAGEHDGGISNAELGALLHFGGTIKHPGGTDYGFKTKRDMKNNRVKFLKKGKGQVGLGTTGAHDITIPPRPWLDVGFQSGNKEYINTLKKVLVDGGTSTQALNAVGMVAVGKVQEYMSDLKTPGNAKSTIRKKGFDNPLIDTGSLRQSVTSRLVVGAIDTLDEGV